MANEDIAKPASAEVHFAQRLAANEKKIRDRAMKKLKKWLEVKSTTKKEKAFTEADFLKIWKGLHYCLWMQDKPLLQEEMSAFISNLVHVFNHADTSLLFVQVFLQTEAREWNGIDRWRLDKFMMLFRNMLTQTLEFLKKKKWKKALITKFTEILSSKLMTVNEDTVPDGLKIHLADIYLDELEKVGSNEVTSDKVLLLLEPFTKYIQNSRNMVVVERVISRVFDAIIDQTVDDAMSAAEKQIEKEEESDEEDKEDSDDLETPPRLQYDFKALADILFQLGSSKDCVNKNRSMIYTLVKKYKDLDEGILPVEESEEDTADVLTKKDISQATQQLTKLTSGKRKKKKKKKASEEEIEDEESPPMDLNSGNKRKTEKRKVEDIVEKDVSPKKKKKGTNKGDIKGQESIQTNTSDGTESSSVSSIMISNKNKTFKTEKTKKGKNSLKLNLSTNQEDITNINSQNSELHDSVNGDLSEHGLSVKKNKKRNKNANKASAENCGETENSELKGDSSLVPSQTSSKSTSKHKYNLAERIDTVVTTDDLSETSEEHVIEIKSKKRRKTSQITVECIEKSESVYTPTEKKTPKEKGTKAKMMKLVDDSSLDVSPKSGGSGFAKFEKLMKTPPAFVRKSVSKLTTPKSAVKKQDKSPPSSCQPDSKKKVIFNMKRNKSLSFQESIQFSPEAFNPQKTPDQGILKTPSPAVTRSKSVLKKEKRRASMSDIKRAKAADFF